MNNITIKLSVEDLTKLMRMVNKASLEDYENATKAMTYATGDNSIDAHMANYEDKQRILDNITEQARICLETEDAHFTAEQQLEERSHQALEGRYGPRG